MKRLFGVCGIVAAIGCGGTITGGTGGSGGASSCATADEVATDSCHASAAGETALGNQAVAKWGV
jgi:hypothetical protein